MTAHNIHQLIGNAVVDREFGQALLQGREEAFKGFDFSEDERRIIRSIRAASVQDLAAGLLKELQVA